MRLDESMIIDRPKFFSFIGALCGSIVLIAGLYFFVNRIVFLINASSYSAPVVSVSHESVSKGKGAVLAYVPTVRVTRSDGTTRDLKVDTSNTEPIYSIGQQMDVVCNSVGSCIENTLLAKWAASLASLLLSVAFFLPMAAWRLGLWPSNGTVNALHLQGDA